MKLWTLQYPSKIKVKGIEVNCETFEHFIFKFRMKRRIKQLGNIRIKSFRRKY